MSEQQLQNVYNNSRKKKYRGWLIFSIIVTIAFCLPAGVAGIVYAVRAQNQFRKEEYSTAERSSLFASRWSVAGFIIGVIYYVYLGVDFILKHKAGTA